MPSHGRFLRPHYLKPNEASKTPRRWIFFDTEAQRTRTSSGEIQTFYCAQAVLDNEGKNRGNTHTSTWATFFTPEDLWQWITSKCISRHRTIVVAHNLGYDLRVSKAFQALTGLGWRCNWIRLDQGNTAAHWSKESTTLQMVDLFSYLPTSIYEIGKLIGLPKLEPPKHDATELDWLAYCRRDVEILQKAYWEILRFHRAEDLGNWQATGSGMAYSAWRHKFYEPGIVVGADEESRKDEREAAWTGRCEVWQHGTHRNGPYTEWDFTLAYGTVARDVSVPIAIVGVLQSCSLQRVRRLSPGIAVLAKVKVTTDRPLAPTRHNEGIIWPVGTFVTTLWTPELLLLEENGAQVEFIWAKAYRTAPVLRRFMDWCISLATESNDVGTPIIRAVAHQWSRSLVGRLGMRYSAWDYYASSNSNDCSLLEGWDLDADESYRLLHIGGNILKETEPIEFANGSPAIMGFIFSEMRVRLWHAMQLASVEHVYYVDTDSLIVDVEGDKNLRLAIDAGKLSGIRPKHFWRHLDLWAPRQICTDTTLKAAGVSKRAIKVQPYTYTAESWQSLRSALLTSNDDKVIITNRTVRLHRQDNRRNHHPGGHTSPIALSEETLCPQS